MSAQKKDWTFYPIAVMVILGIITIATGAMNSGNSANKHKEANTDKAVATEAQATPETNATAATTENTAEAKPADTASANKAPAEEVKTTEAASEAKSANAADLLRAAREAYWSKEYERSIGFYKELIALDGQPDYKGELANVHWKNNQSAEASSLYLEIAPWLAEQGRTQELVNMKLYMDLVDPKQAQQIESLLK